MKTIWFFCGILFFLSLSSYAQWNSLGVNVNGNSTTFSIWSPSTDDVSLSVESAPNRGDFETYKLSKIPDFKDNYGYEYTDVYSLTIPLNLELCRYKFLINGNAVRDPYGRMVVDNKTISNLSGWQGSIIDTPYNIVIDLSKVMQDVDFSPIKDTGLKNKTDAIVYETHIVDFTFLNSVSKDDIDFNPKFVEYFNKDNTIDDTYINPYTGSKGLAGTFLAMAQSGTMLDRVSTGLDHLVDLGGITHVHIMPFFNFSFSGSNYSFGHDPMDYNVPQVNYSSLLQPANADSYVNYIGRIVEVQQMINLFHKNGIRVLLDIVYSYTTNTSIFGTITPMYYGQTFDGYVSLNTQNPMVSNMIRDSMEYWVDVYNLDGFRIDMMQLIQSSIPIPNETQSASTSVYSPIKDWMGFFYKNYPEVNMLLLGDYLTSINVDGYYPVGLGSLSLTEPFLDNILYPGASGFNWIYNQAIIGNFQNAYNEYAYVFNSYNEDNDTLKRIAIGSRGSIRERHISTLPIPMLDNLDDPMFANFPSESINYVDYHNGFTLWDTIREWASKSKATQEYQQQIDLLTIGIVMTSQGIPYFSGGDEFLRSKNIDLDKASASDFTLLENIIDWDFKIDNKHIVDFYKKLIRIRSRHPIFRLSTWQDVNDRIQTFYSSENYNMQSGVVVNILDGKNLPGERWTTAIVIYNVGGDYSYVIPNVWGSNKRFEIALDISDAVSTRNPNKKIFYYPGNKVTCAGSSVTILYSSN